jgi:hypothetical protein
MTTSRHCGGLFSSSCVLFAFAPIEKRRRSSASFDPVNHG